MCSPFIGSLTLNVTLYWTSSCQSLLSQTIVYIVNSHTVYYSYYTLNEMMTGVLLNLLVVVLEAAL